MKLNKIIVAVSLDEVTQKPFQYLKELGIPQNSEIQLVHLVTESFVPDGSGFELKRYPEYEDRPAIIEEIQKGLNSLKTQIFPQHTNVRGHVLFDTNIKAAFTDYVEKQNPDLVVVATRGRRGIKNFFDSSFAQHQLKYSPATVLVLR